MKIKDMMTENTKILGGPYDDDYDIPDISSDGLDKYVHYQDMVVKVDWKESLVLCFKDDELVAVWNVYDLYDVHLSSTKRMVTATGHETVHHYWFDDNHYEEKYTR